MKEYEGGEKGFLFFSEGFRLFGGVFCLSLTFSALFSKKKKKKKLPPSSLLFVLLIMSEPSCVKCGTTSHPRWHQAPAELQPSKHAMELRNEPMVCGPCLNGYLRDKNQVACSPPILDVPG